VEFDVTAVQISPAGDRAFLLRLGAAINPEIAASVLGCFDALEAARPPWVVDLVPAYGTLMVEVDPRLVAAERARAWILEVVEGAGPRERVRRRRTVPVLYEPEVAPDLLEVARMCGMPVEEFVRRHTAREYLVYMLGFKPGFPYMGELDERLETPRLATPRTTVPPGSVAIAGRQTGIYPLPSPGGWRIIGRTPLRLFDPHGSEPFLLLAGDVVRFEAVGRERFDALASGQERSQA
jgi:inhibitor of KinA